METPATISKLLTTVYPRQGPLANFITRWRSYICPFHKLLELIPEGNISLDVGCGAGYMTILMAYHGKIKRGIGIDTSMEKIETARAVKAPDGVNLEFHRIEAEDDWPEGNYDNILSIDVLHHIPRSEQRHFIKKLCRVSPGANIIFKDVSPRPFWKMAANIFHDLLLSREWIHVRDEEEVKEWFLDEGCKVTVAKRMDMLCYSHYLIIAQRMTDQGGESQ